MSRYQKPDAYHHGDLRRALLDAARLLIEENGIEGLSLREVARRAGVSSAAPYYHFADKAALIEALAQDSFEHLNHVFQEAISNLADPRQKLEKIGVMYALYAFDHPSEFRIMFGRDLPSPLNNVREENGPAYDLFTKILHEVLDGNGKTDEQRLVVTISVWALVHGLATLILEGPLSNNFQSRDQVKELASQVMANSAFALTKLVTRQ